ncbi:2-hydroxyacid dehydrogenase [Pseudoxanthobacter sp.]|uniref:2-hydroxyacid dehydrogenase n=1 Tax=Pseudoxanthobacter sp. TaxID=1925742 RepID=UPI002FE233BD
MDIDLLLAAPQGSYLDDALAARFTVHRLDAVKDPVAFYRDVAPRIRAVVAGGSGFAGEVMARLPALEIVAANAVGYDRLDLDQARRRGIRITNTPDVLTDDVADLAVGLMLSVIRRIAAADRFVRDGRWHNGAFALTVPASGRHYGLVGLGRIGRAVARRLEGFGGRISYSGPHQKADVPYGYFRTPLELARACDVLILCAPATVSTRHLADQAVLDALGPSGVLINIARGSLVDEHALIDALIEGRIAGAGLDVFENEPRVPLALLSRSNVVVTPHIGSATVSTRHAMADLVLSNLEAWRTGRPLLTPVV